ncbi:MAG: glutamyl-tRNA reductase [Acidimicrobiales bacterium]
MVVGLEHRQAPLDLLERVTLGEHDLAKVLGTLRDRANIQESVVLSTCLRTEVYAVVDRFHDAVHEIQDVFAQRAGLPADQLEPHCMVRFDEDVATHLFSVASGLESAVPGEGEVLGQVRRALERAQGEHAAGPVLAELFRHAVRTGKRVRTETAIARGTTSFAYAAVELAEGRREGGLAGATVVVIGAGTMGAGVFEALCSLPDGRRPAELVMANRTTERAEALVRSAPAGITARAIGTAGLAGELVRADAVVSAVEVGTVEQGNGPSRPGHLLGVSQLAPGGSRTGHPVLVVDLGMPRNADPAAAAVPGVTLLDMDHLTSVVARAMAERRIEAQDAGRIVADEVARYRTSARARGAAPVVASLRSRLEAVRRAELERRRLRFTDLSEGDWEQVDAVTRSVLAKLVHQPTVVLKDTAGSPRGDRLVEALRTLFDL